MYNDIVTVGAADPSILSSLDSRSKPKDWYAYSSCQQNQGLARKLACPAARKRLCRPVEAIGLERDSWINLRESPSVLFISSEASEGVQLVSEFRAAHPSTRIGVLAVTDRDEEFVTWASVGISGYVDPDTPAQGIVATIARLAEGEIIYPARLSALLLSHFSHQSTNTSVKGLTRRELEVIRLLADGQPNKRIARYLAITDATVKNHVHSILEKLNVRSRGEAAAYFHRLPAAPKPADEDDRTATTNRPSP